MTAAPSTDEPLPFQGLKVIDCASFIAAPVAATLLADLGADVIKVEPPGGDPHRTLFQRVGCLPDPALVSRTHFARYLLDKGYCKTMQGVFSAKSMDCRIASAQRSLFG